MSGPRRAALAVSAGMLGVLGVLVPRGATSGQPSPSAPSAAPGTGREAAASVRVGEAGTVTPRETGQKPLPVSSCVACHGLLAGRLQEAVASWSSDVHAAAGLGCESCHGGDGSARLSDDAQAAMDPKKGFRSAPDRLHVPEFCGVCHADAVYMKKFNPQARVDQLAEYRTSVHGKLNAKGDPEPATCIDCHGVHGIRPVTSPESAAYATNVPKTCARCHSDAAKMARYGIPTNQYDEYRLSVHAAALLDGGDTAAPACNDCHGNHGASPPGVSSVAHVCGQCHGREATLFEASFKKELFAQMEVGECSVCHHHHKVRHPTPDLFHGPSEPQVSTGAITGREPFAARIGDLSSGQKASAEWRIIIKPRVGTGDGAFSHRVELTAQSMEPLVIDATVRPGDSPPVPDTRRADSPALAVSLTVEPLSGLPVQEGDSIRLRLDLEAMAGGAREVIVRDLPGTGLDVLTGSACRTCHETGDTCDQATERMYSALMSLDHDLRQGGAALKAASIAGMEVSTATFELKSKGTSAAVEARALIHAFDEARLQQRVTEGRAVAESALAEARRAMEELQFRRKGFAVSVALASLVLLGLYLKIRQLDRERAREEQASVPGPGGLVPPRPGG